MAVDPREQKQKAKTRAEQTQEEAPEAGAASPSGLQLKRTDEFESLYANNVRFEPSVWDLRAIFGILDQGDAKAPFVEQHTAISLPWPTAKIAAYYLAVFVASQQAQSGIISLRPDVIPPRPNVSATDVDSSQKPIIEYLAWIHDQFFGSNPYVPPSVQQAQEQATREAEKQEPKA
jgi:hypothetical protein